MGAGLACRSGRKRTVAWALLIAAGVLEIVWAIALDNAEGFTRIWPFL
jgi:quaternary ammonium compound-resistance protein SugE